MFCSDTSKIFHIASGDDAGAKRCGSAIVLNALVKQEVKLLSLGIPFVRAETGSNNLTCFSMGGETRAPESKQGHNRRALPGNPGASCCEAVVLTTDSPCYFDDV